MIPHSLTTFGCCLFLTALLASTARAQPDVTIEVVPIGEVGASAENVFFELTADQSDTNVVLLKWADGKRLGFEDPETEGVSFFFQLDVGEADVIGFLTDENENIIQGTGFIGTSQLGSIDVSLFPGQTFSGMLLISDFGGNIMNDGTCCWYIIWDNSPTVVAERGSPYIPSDLKPGDKYHIAFQTRDTTTAQSTDIAFYNEFVQDQANGGSNTGPLGLNWFAIASTPTVDARDNVPVDAAPVYLLPLDPFGSDFRLADNAADLWDGSLPYTIDINQSGLAEGTQTIWTGTASDGTQFPSLGLGTLMPRVGYNGVIGDPTWVSASLAPFTTELSMYAISEELTVPTKGCEFEIGDVNQDGSVDLLDVDPFIALLSAGDFLCEADIDGDGAVTLLDVDPFITLLSGG